MEQGVSLYGCGGGTIPLIFEWLAMGMSMGSASALMITGLASKIINFGALRIVLGGNSAGVSRANREMEDGGVNWVRWALFVEYCII